MKKQRLIIFSFLISFLFSGIGVVSGLPIFFTALAHAHPVFFTADNHKIRLTLHHPGNHDTHESVSGSAKHQHDLLDSVIGISDTESRSHADHEIEISTIEGDFSTSSATALERPIVASTLSISNFSIGFFRENQSRFSGFPPPGIHHTHFSRHRSLLLI